MEVVDGLYFHQGELLWLGDVTVKKVLLAGQLLHLEFIVLDSDTNFHAQHTDQVFEQTEEVK